MKLKKPSLCTILLATMSVGGIMGLSAPLIYGVTRDYQQSEQRYEQPRLNPNELTATVSGTGALLMFGSGFAMMAGLADKRTYGPSD